MASSLYLAVLTGNGVNTAILLSDAVLDPQEKSGTAWLLN